MRLDVFASTLERRAISNGLEYELRPARSVSEIVASLEKLHLDLPESVFQFYQFCDGFFVRSPHLEVLPVHSLKLNSRDLLFATFDHEHHVAFNTSSRNVADEWDIVNVCTGFLITHTFASFITNKTWAWIDRQRPVWLDEFGSEGCSR